MNLVQHERLGQAGEHLGHVANTPGRLGSLGRTRHAPFYSLAGGAAARSPCWDDTMVPRAPCDPASARPARHATRMTSRSTAILGVSAGAPLAHESHGDQWHAHDLLDKIG